ncbi:uncharacterized protein N7511_003769 [Penicillium nucicola]|uniref:uncharacterized protein n=1 Tax=Penicillium nucicola TaxID=1850975 RepID=UPI002545B1FC|nr:uncharacterized protein N7511_003769 [Penicillium nucicola]KAJ5766153.1 hypothetical protein N7511_003769 [Penicillium nucicola]
MEFQIFPVTRNLHNALRRLRLGNRPRRMWIDQICIRQQCNCGDDGHTCEKKQQIRKIGHVFSKATRVIIWLGEPDIPCKLEESKDKIFKALKSAISTKLVSPWWTRAWVIEEYALASEDPVVMFGPYEKSWDELLELIEGRRNTVRYAMGQIAEMGLYLDHYEPLRKPKIPREAGSVGVILQDQILRNPNFERNLHFLSVVLRDTQTRNPEDKILCILPSLPEKERELTLNGCGATASQIFAQATYASIASTGSIGILSLAPRLSYRRAQKMETPTWAVEFTFPEKYTLRNHHWPEGGLREKLEDRFNHGFQIMHPLLTYGIFEFVTRQRSWCQRYPQAVAEVFFNPNHPRVLALTGLEFDYIQDVMDMDNRATMRNFRPDLVWFQGFISMTAASSTSKPVSVFDSLSFDSTDRDIMSCIKQKALFDNPYNQIGSVKRKNNYAMRLPPQQSVRFPILAAHFRAWDKVHKPQNANRKGSFLPSAGKDLIKIFVDDFFEDKKGSNAEEDVYESLMDPYDSEWFEYFCNVGFLLAFYFDSRGSTFFVTGAGFLGIGPADLRPDDKIVLPYGSRYPIALRHYRDSIWHLVGFIYVHGIMEEGLWNCFPDIELKQTEFWME